MTTPVILMVAGFRLAAELWPLKQDEDAFRIVSATLLAALAWHWFPVVEAINLFTVAEAEEQPKDNTYNNTVDFIFLCNLILGHLSVLGLLWRILPTFFSDDLAYERQDQTAAAARNVEV